MNNLIYCYDEETKIKLLEKKFTLLKADAIKGEFIFINDKPSACFEDISKKVMFSNKMTF